MVMVVDVVILVVNFRHQKFYLGTLYPDYAVQLVVVDFNGGGSDGDGSSGNGGGDNGG